MCGIFGIIGAKDASYLTAVALHALQHRGQEAAGIVSFDVQHDPIPFPARKEFHEYRAGGLVNSIFTEDVRKSLVGHAAIGHVRYSTSGAKQEKPTLQARDAQPFVDVLPFGGLAIAHNGNLTNAKFLRHKLELKGHTFQTRKEETGEVVDTEVALKLIGSAAAIGLIERLKVTLPLLEGAYAFVMLTKKKLIGICDPWAIRPLVLGRAGTAYMFASETCALTALGAQLIRSVEPGEIVVIEDGAVSSHRFAPIQKPRNCIFEQVYFSRPDSFVWGKNAHLTRMEDGRELARQAPVPADVVVDVPDSGKSAALGYARESGIPYDIGIVRNHYVGRTFIQKTQEERERDVELKHSIIEDVVRGQRVIMVDDSLVRGTTAKRLVARLFESGASEVHMRIASPPWRFGCHYGIDEADVNRRIAKPHESVEEVCRRVKEITKATSVAYLSVDGMYQAVHGETRNGACPQSCDACFTGSFPTPLTDIFGGHMH